MSAGMTRAERSARNKLAHAIRRRLTDDDARQARGDGLELAWRQIADQYAAMSTDDILSTFGDALEAPAPVPAVTVPDQLEPRRVKRSAPVHVQRAQLAFRLAREAWEAGLEHAVAGGRTLADGGKPAAGETYPDEERDYRAGHPAPVFKDFLSAECAAMRHAADTGAVTA